MAVIETEASLWPRLARLPLVIESYELERVDPDRPSSFERYTTHVRLIGGGTDGLGEEISMPEDQAALQDAGPSLPLRGEWTLESFCDHLGTVDQWPNEPEWEQMRLYRNWTYESAALDLALQQVGKPLHEVLELEPRPVRFVNSLGLGDPPMIEPSKRKPPRFEPLRKRVDRYPELRYKLDVELGWTPELIAQVAATGAVEQLDFKGLYGFEVEDVAALEDLYERILEAFPEALIEDPHDLREITALLQPHVARVSYDAPIHSVDDIAATALPAPTVNIKPSRAGGLRPLFALYAHCEANGLRMYGGGMGELGVGRGQVQLLASLFHADSPNDVAPSGYNATDPPEGLFPSPLAPPTEPTGFRWAA
jgi:L-alanine-DL-glutamate epimerase-like enolase superfamily enzyme